MSARRQEPVPWKSVWLIWVPALFLVACGQTPQLTTAEAEEVVRDLYHAIEQSDGDAMRALLTEDFQLAEPERGVRWTREDFVSTVLAFEGRGIVDYELDEFFTELCADAGAYTGYRNRLTFEPVAGGDAVRDATIEFSVVTMTPDGPKIDRIHGFIVPPGQG